VLGLSPARVPTRRDAIPRENDRNRTCVNGGLHAIGKFTIQLEGRADFGRGRALAGGNVLNLDEVSSGFQRIY
jgi:hypothetical protein